MNICHGQAMFDCQPKYQAELEAAAAINDKCRYYRAILGLSECVVNHPEVDNKTKQTISRELPKYRQQIQDSCNQISKGLENPGSDRFEGATERRIIEDRRNFANQMNNFNNSKLNHVQNELSNIESEVDKYRDDPLKNLVEPAGSVKSKNTDISDFEKNVFNKDTNMGMDRIENEMKRNLKIPNDSEWMKNKNTLNRIAEDYNSGTDILTGKINNVFGEDIVKLKEYGSKAVKMASDIDKSLGIREAIGDAILDVSLTPIKDYFSDYIPSWLKSPYTSHTKNAIENAKRRYKFGEAYIGYLDDIFGGYNSNDVARVEGVFDKLNKDILILLPGGDKIRRFINIFDSK